MAFHSFEYCVKNREASIQQLDWAKLIGNRSEHSALLLDAQIIENLRQHDLRACGARIDAQRFSGKGAGGAAVFVTV